MANDDPWTVEDLKKHVKVGRLTLKEAEDAVQFLNDNYDLEFPTERDAVLAAVGFATIETQTTYALVIVESFETLRLYPCASREACMMVLKRYVWRWWPVESPANGWRRVKPAHWTQISDDDITAYCKWRGERWEINELTGLIQATPESVDAEFGVD